MKTELINHLNYAHIRDAFVTELTEAAQGHATSLPYIKTPLPYRSLMEEGIFQALVIGGTHYETNIAELTAKGQVNHVSPMQKGHLPKFDTANLFLETIHKLLAPNISYVSLNLAYPLIPTLRDGILDGKLAYATKEHAFEGLLGKAIGNTIEEYVLTKENRHIKVVVANDTACLVLAGLENKNNIQRNMLASCVVGSGFNIAFFSNQDTIVNLEAASFDKFQQTPTGKQIDDASQYPGKGIYEKEVSGIYLYQHYNLLRDQFGLHTPPLHDSKELSDIAASGSGLEAELAQVLLKRSASLVAAQMAAIYMFKDTVPALTFVTEGSVFRKAWHYEQMVNEVLERLDVPLGAITFLHLENSSLLGAAHLLNIKRN